MLRFLPIAVVPLIIFGLFIICFILFQDSRIESSGLAVYGQVPEFTLIDSNAKEFSSNQLTGKIWVADFIFTKCAGPCLDMSQKMAEFHKNFQKDDRVRMISVSVDPSRDSPQVLDAYASRYGADTNIWYFLTGPSESIHKLAFKGFKVSSVEDSINHSTYFVLVDQKMQIRGYYDGVEQEKMSQLSKDIVSLLEEI
jgi:protein SCO1/2